MIRHKFDPALGIHQFRFTASSGDIYIGDHYSSDHCEHMFKIGPAVLTKSATSSVIEYAAPDEINFVFKENFHGYPDVIVRLYKMSTKDSARRQVADAAADEIINHILTERIKSLERRTSILEKII